MDAVNLHHRAYKLNILYLGYRRIRPAFGLPLGFILMYGAYTGTFTLPLLTAGFAFFLIHLFGDCYNDYRDFDEDIHNDRKDKFTTIGLLDRYQMGDLSLLIVTIALLSLVFTNIWALLLGIYYMLLLIGYSHPRIRLKGHIGGYFALSSMFLFLPMALNSLIIDNFFRFSIIFALFFFFQFMYILCQKDSTDTKDDTNLFIDKGWEQSSFITLVFATLSSAFLFIICTGSIWLILVWGINASSKILNLSKIWKRDITRELRSKLILIEFLTPYIYLTLYLGGGAIGL